MPIVDMPLPELEPYQGLTPRPADFDAYWESAIAEQQSTDPEPEQRPADRVRAERQQQRDGVGVLVVAGDVARRLSEADAALVRVYAGRAEDRAEGAVVFDCSDARTPAQLAFAPVEGARVATVKMPSAPVDCQRHMPAGTEPEPPSQHCQELPPSHRPYKKSCSASELISASVAPSA